MIKALWYDTILDQDIVVKKNNNTALFFSKTLHKFYKI